MKTTRTLPLVAALAMLTATASAQTFTNTTANAAPAGKYSVSVGTLSSATTIKGVGVGSFENVFVSCVGTAASTSQTVLYRTDTRTLFTESVNCTTSPLMVVSRTAPIAGFNNIVVSPTAGLTAANVVTNTIVRTPSVR